MTRIQIFAYVVLAGLALYLVGSTLIRMHDGRCAVSYGSFRRALDCSYPARRAQPRW